MGLAWRQQGREMLKEEKPEFYINKYTFSRLCVAGRPKAACTDHVSLRVATQRSKRCTPLGRLWTLSQNLFRIHPCPLGHAGRRCATNGSLIKAAIVGRNGCNKYILLILVDMSIRYCPKIQKDESVKASEIIDRMEFHRPLVQHQ